MSNPSLPLSDVQERALWVLGGVEGGYHRVEADPHGNGLSCGILGWNQRDGTLIKLLHAYQQADPGAVVRIFGKDWDKLFSRAASPPPSSALSRSPWSWQSIQRFREAGLYAPFQDVQNCLTLAPELTAEAVNIAHVLHVRKLAGLVLGLYHVAKMGPRGALEPALVLASKYAAEPSSRPHAAVDVLQEYVVVGARRFSSTAGPPIPGCAWPGPVEEQDRFWRPVRWEWRFVERNGVYRPDVIEVEGVWHAFAGTGKKARDLHEHTILQGWRLLSEHLLWDRAAPFEEIVDGFTSPPQGGKVA